MFSRAVSIFPANNFFTFFPAGVAHKVRWAIVIRRATRCSTSIIDAGFPEITLRIGIANEDTESVVTGICFSRAGRIVPALRNQTLSERRADFCFFAIAV